MNRYLSSAVVIGALALPVTVLAQHTNSGGASTGTATSSAPAPSSGSSGSSSGGGSSSSSGSGSSSSGGTSTGTYAATPPTRSSGGHVRGGTPANGTAVPRGSVPGSGGTIVVTEGSGFYPWGYGGAIAGGFYGGYYDGYSGAYDPWYGWFPAYAPVAGGVSDETGGLRLRVKPNDATVYVDSFYVGVVDDFDGAFQKLKLDRGPHRIEIRSPQHMPLAFDVMIQEDFTITYRGELAKQ